MPWVVHDAKAWSEASCPDLTRVLGNRGLRIGMAALRARTSTKIEGILNKIMWIWDNKKTKAGTEAKSLQETMSRCST
jgi:hypothetical protein